MKQTDKLYDSHPDTSVSPLLDSLRKILGQYLVTVGVRYNVL